MTKITAIRQQRPDRISLILNKLEENEYIKSTIDISANPNTKVYLVTEKGLDAYLKWIKEFLSFVRSMNDKDNNEEMT